MKRLIYTIRSDGLLAAVRKTASYLSNKAGLPPRDYIHEHKLRLSRSLNERFADTIAYGPFKGMKFSSDTWWGRTDRASMLLGVYEKELLDCLEDVPATHRTFIDLGAADGYYGVGVLVSGRLDSAHCYELTEAGRKTIQSNALANRVDDRLTIHGPAESKFYQALRARGVDLATCVMLCDIEGAEFDLLDRDLFEAFDGAVILIELHDWRFADGASRLERLKRDASVRFVLREYRTGARDPSRYPELASLNDDDRWLICSEGRGRLMTWLRLDPKLRPSPAIRDEMSE